MRLRSVELQVTGAPAACDFLERVWGLAAVQGQGDRSCFRGSGDHPHILCITAAPAPAITAITFSGTGEELDAVRVRAGGLTVQGPEGETYRFVPEHHAAALAAGRDQPVELSHVVLNATDVAASERFAVEVLGFRVSDRTRMMTFVRCNRKHHCIAYARAEAPSLNHIAFELPDIEAVMRGIGRMRDAGYACAWGPGRHGPGNNVFAYFIAPFGAVVEYTAEVSAVGDDYKVGGPGDWQWPPGRIDHWGVSGKDTARLAAAELTFRWPASASGRTRAPSARA
ncbi:MAG: VOC family protein [Pseudomonadota bacterium]|nr:VOC family protein [Pseudomonadota bacterium]